MATIIYYCRKCGSERNAETALVRAFKIKIKKKTVLENGNPGKTYLEEEMNYTKVDRCMLCHMYVVKIENKKLFM